MNHISRIAITDALFVSSTVAENDYAAWNAATNYTAGTSVIRTAAGVHGVFKAVAGGVNATPPESAPATQWLRVSATNRWKMFDDEVATLTTGTSPMTIVVKPGLFDSLCLVELDCDTVEVTLRDGTGGPVVYSKTVSMDRSLIADVYDWFFAPVVKAHDVILTDIPPYANGELTVTLTSASTVNCGVIYVGSSMFIGQTKFGAKAGIDDFSTVNFDATFGKVLGVTKRGFRKKAQMLVKVENARLDAVFRYLSDQRSTLSFFAGVENGRDIFTPLNIFGFYKSFEVEISYPGYSVLSIDIQGVV